MGDRGRLLGGSEEDAVHPAPREIAEQLLQTGLHAVDVGVVTKARLDTDPGDSRLIDVDLPGMKVEDGRLLLDLVDPSEHPARCRVREQPEIAAAA